KGEVHPVEQLLVEGMRVFYPKLYRSIRENPDIVLGSGYEGTRSEEPHRRLKALLQDALGDLPAPLQTSARKLISALFPRTRAAFGGSNFGSDWNARWEEEKRVSSQHYFPRYFQYAVPSGDVPDTAIDQF